MIPAWFMTSNSSLSVSMAWLAESTCFPPVKHRISCQVTKEKEMGNRSMRMPHALLQFEEWALKAWV